MKSCLKICAVLFLSLLLCQSARTEPTPADESNLNSAIFAGGCFWCMQFAFDHAPGVKKTVVGYCGGTKPNPTYEDVSTGETGYAESIKVFYDPKQTNYQKLLDVFWTNIDPTTVDQQFADRGNEYRTIIFYEDEGQKNEAEKSKSDLQKTSDFANKKIVTQILPAMTFYPAEEYHQKFYQKNPSAFESYEKASGREEYLRDKSTH